MSDGDETERAKRADAWVHLLLERLAAKDTAGMASLFAVGDVTLFRDATEILLYALMAAQRSRVDRESELLGDVADQAALLLELTDPGVES